MNDCRGGFQWGLLNIINRLVHRCRDHEGPDQTNRYDEITNFPIPEQVGHTCEQLFRYLNV